VERRPDRGIPPYDDALSAVASSASAQFPPDDCVWRADAKSIVYRDWDDRLVVFNETTGHTHHLDPLGRAVMLLLLNHVSGLTIHEMVPVIGNALTDTSAAAVAGTLHELTNVGLVDCLPR
jgi:hypothetical protein